MRLFTRIIAKYPFVGKLRQNLGRTAFIFSDLMLLGLESRWWLCKLANALVPFFAYPEMCLAECDLKSSPRRGKGKEYRVNWTLTECVSKHYELYFNGAFSGIPFY